MLPPRLPWLLPLIPPEAQLLTHLATLGLPSDHFVKVPGVVASGFFFISSVLFKLLLITNCITTAPPNSITLLNPSKGPVAGRTGFYIPSNPWPVAPLYFSISDAVMEQTRLWKHTDSPVHRSKLSPYTLQMAALCAQAKGFTDWWYVRKLDQGRNISWFWNWG